MNVYSTTKVLLEFGRLETLCVDWRCKKLLNFVTSPIHVKSGLMHTLTHMSTPLGLSVHYETLKRECVHYNKGPARVW